MERILVIGCSAAGKSTVARELGRILDIPVIHLDTILWKPGCKLADEDEEMREVRRLLEADRWVLDGNYTASLPMRVAAADTIVVVDFPRHVCLSRALKRLLRFRGRTRPDMGAGCPERLNLSFLLWIWRYPQTERPELLHNIWCHGGHAHVVTLTSQDDVEKWLAHLRDTCARPARRSLDRLSLAPTVRK